MKYTNPLCKLTTFLFLAIIITSCQEDFNTVGSDIIADPNFEFDLFDETSVVAYSRRAIPVQTNNLPVYQLGVFNDPVYGLTESSILSQLTLDQTNPTFGENVEIKKVILNLPYFSTDEGTGEDQIFKLDSIFGGEPFKLSVYESNYFLRDFDPTTGFDSPQLYYSNQGPIFQNFLGLKLFDSIPFKPSSDPTVLFPGEDNEETLSPRLRVEMDMESNPEALNLFKEKILDQEGNDVLLNNTNFKNHFRGIYFIAEAINNQGTMILLDLNNANIEVVYERDPFTGDGGDGRSHKSNREDERVEETLTLSLNGVNVNTFKNNLPTQLENVLNNPNTEGAENLYLKGGAGTITVIELFGEDIDGNNVADELDDLRTKKWIINEANLTFKVNKNIVPSESSEPERVFLYDLNNNRILIDYELDNSSSSSDLVNFKTNHLGRLQRDDSNNGEYYRLRITNHVSNLINKDSTNVRLGLVVSQNINLISSQALQNTLPLGIESIPSANVISPEGTVLYGSNPSNPEEKVKLNIYYTEINN